MIPDDHKRAIEVLAGLSDPVFASFAAQIKAAPLVSDLADLAHKISGLLPRRSIPPRDVKELVNFVGELASWEAVDENVGSETIAKGVSAVGKQDKKFNASTPDIKWDRFESRLLKLLEEPGAIGLVSKAAEILQQSERRLCPDNCKILTDIRPIFPYGEAYDPVGAVILFTLKLAFHRAGNENVDEMYFTLAESDLDLLDSLISRARAKSSGLKRVVNSARIPYLGQSYGQAPASIDSSK